MATVFPAKYFDIQGLPQPSAAAGSCLLTPTATMVRPKIGGKRWMPPHIQRRRKTQKHKRKTQKHMCVRMRTQKRRQQGGFLPSIGEPFAAAAAKYIAPLALFGIYRFLNPIKKGKSGTRRTRRS